MSFVKKAEENEFALISAMANIIAASNTGAYNTPEKAYGLLKECDNWWSGSGKMIQKKVEEIEREKAQRL